MTGLAIWLSIGIVATLVGFLWTWREQDIVASDLLIGLTLSVIGPSAWLVLLISFVMSDPKRVILKKRGAE